ncbi:MAG: conserved phage C-terminal domain-containing protein [Clostridia bacterium]|nr:conserved phage C-terminal domain-containing protein [Clostridia bacterium]
MSESRVKGDSYILIQGWMINELKLKGNELLIYAIIYGFSQDNAGEFTGGLQYLMDWTNSTKPGVIKTLKSLVNKNLIVKKEHKVDGAKYCSYRSTKFTGVVNKVNQGSKQSLPEGSKQSLLNNLSTDNIENNLYKYIVEIVDYLNQKSGKKFSSETPSTQKHISARLKEGRTVGDFKRVIDTKCAQWLGTNMAMYIRPETLFTPTHFENYLNETIGGGNSGSNSELDTALFGRRG